MKTSCADRFLHYVTFDTQAREGSDTYPSTLKQLELSRYLVEELELLWLEQRLSTAARPS